MREIKCEIHKCEKSQKLTLLAHEYQGLVIVIAMTFTNSVGLIIRNMKKAITYSKSPE